MAAVNERQIGIGCLYAAVAWGTAVALTMAGTGVAIMVDGEKGVELAMVVIAHAFLCVAVAVTLTIRNMLKRQTRLLRGAFDLGRESTSVRRLPGY